MSEMIESAGSALAMPLDDVRDSIGLLQERIEQRLPPGDPRRLVALNTCELMLGNLESISALFLPELEALACERVR